VEQSRLEKMTARQLVDVYNAYGPVRQLRTWKRRKADLIAKIRIAEKQTGVVGALFEQSRLQSVKRCCGRARESVVDARRQATAAITRR
jgi:hypothetical protein